MLGFDDWYSASGRADDSHRPNYVQLDKTSYSHQASTTTKNRGTLRALPSVTPDYRPFKAETALSLEKIRPKRELKTPVMSGYGNPLPDQTGYTYTSAPQAGVPQYTRTQINQYYLQYQCYPPQPYHIIADCYVQAPTTTQYSHQRTLSRPAYDTHWHAQGNRQEPNLPQELTRTNSRTRTWNCDISSCTSSANFTRLADLQRHQSTVHGVGTPEYPCMVPHCNRVADKGFTRRDHLVEHLRNFHHMDIPKRRPGERSAFPFGWPEGSASQ